MSFFSSSFFAFVSSSLVFKHFRSLLLACTIDGVSVEFLVVQLLKMKRHANFVYKDAVRIHRDIIREFIFGEKTSARIVSPVQSRFRKDYFDSAVD